MNKEVNTFARSQVIVVEPTSGSVSVINAGPPGATGPAGPPGPPGSGGGGEGFPITQSDADYTYTVEIPDVFPSGMLRMLNYDTVDGDLAAAVTASTDIPSQQAQTTIGASTIFGEADVAAHAEDATFGSYIYLKTDGHPTYLRVGVWNPNGVPASSVPAITSSKGSIFIDIFAGKMYINTDGATTWDEVYSGYEAGTIGTYEYYQPTASDTWTIDHNLGYKPNITVMDSSGEQIVPDISHTSDDQAVLTFSAPVAGEAYLS